MHVVARVGEVSAVAAVDERLRGLVHAPAGRDGGEDGDPENPPSLAQHAVSQAEADTGWYVQAPHRAT
jgi:hypothetical protein